MKTTISNLHMLSMLVAAGRFAHPEGDGGDAGGDKSADKGADKSTDKGGAEGGDKSKDKAGDEGGKPPIPYSRFSEVNEAKRTAEASLATANSEVTRLTTENEQLKSTDKSGALTAVQNELKDIKAELANVDKEFEDMLEIALAPLPKEKAAIVRDIPGGPRKQFAWFNKHRSALAGDDAEGGDKGGPKGPKNEKKPGGKDKPTASAAATAFVATQKPTKAGFAGLN